MPSSAASTLLRTVLVTVATTALLVTPAPAGAAPAPAQRPRPAEVERQLREEWERLEVVVEEYNDVREDLKATQARTTALEQQIAPLRDAMRAGEERVGGIAARAYRAGGPAQISTLLAATSPEQFVDRLTVVHRLTRQQTRALGSLAETRRRHEATHRQLVALAAEQGRHQGELAERKRHIEAEIRRLEKLRGGDRWRSRPARPRDVVPLGYVPAHAPGAAGAAVRFAHGQLGKPYRWGSDGPGGYDCSGLTSAAWRKAGVRLPHNSARQWHAVRPVSRAELRPGDIVFYYADIHHVGLYVGDGRIIHAPGHGERVRFEAVGYAPVYGYGRPPARG